MYIIIQITMNLLVFLFCIPIRTMMFEPNIMDHQDSIAKAITTVVTLLPKILRNSEKCKIDEDCPGLMKCCHIENNKVCCMGEGDLIAPHPLLISKPNIH